MLLKHRIREGLDCVALSRKCDKLIQIVLVSTHGDLRYNASHETKSLANSSSELLVSLALVEVVSWPWLVRKVLFRFSSSHLGQTLHCR